MYAPTTPARRRRRGDARALRHTYLVYLLRQGIRFADIGRIVGRLPPQELAAYMRYAPSQPRLPLEQIELVLPALRGPTG